VLLDESPETDALDATAHGHVDGFVLRDCHCAFLPRNQR
jgi:hypothetical protein